MKKGNEPAFPRQHWSGNSEGMTKREYFAAKAMQTFIFRAGEFNEAERLSICKESIKYADTILKELEK